VKTPTSKDLARATYEIPLRKLWEAYLSDWSRLNGLGADTQYREIQQFLDSYPKRVVSFRFYGYAPTFTEAGKKRFWCQFNGLRPRLRFPNREGWFELLDSLCQSCPPTGLSVLDTWFSQACVQMKISLDLTARHWYHTFRSYDNYHPAVQLWLLQHGLERKGYEQELRAIWLLDHPKGMEALLGVLSPKQQEDSLYELLYHYFSIQQVSWNRTEVEYQPIKCFLDRLIAMKLPDRPYPLFLTGSFHKLLQAQDASCEAPGGRTTIKCQRYQKQVWQMCYTSIILPSLFDGSDLLAMKTYIEDKGSFHQLVSRNDL
jgi:hypothetical protein